MKITIKNIYFYLISFISLLIVLFNAQAVITTVLQLYVFKSQPKYTWQPPNLPFVNNSYYRSAPEAKLTETQEAEQKQILDQLKNGEALTAEQKQLVTQWLRDYEYWKQEQENQQRAVVNNLIANITSLIIFAPVFYLHIRKARES